MLLKHWKTIAAIAALCTGYVASVVGAYVLLRVVFQYALQQVGFFWAAVAVLGVTLAVLAVILFAIKLLVSRIFNP